MEDSRNALFVEPNAYIQNFNRQKKEDKIKKIVFQEPYDCLPNFYIDNNFKKGDCNCVHKPQKNNATQNKNNNNSCCTPKKFGLNFDLKSLLPLMNMLDKNSGGFANLLSVFSKDVGGSGGLSSLLSNPNTLSNLTSLFGKKKESSNQKKEIITTDYEIKNYTKVE